VAIVKSVSVTYVGAVERKDIINELRVDHEKISNAGPCVYTR